MTRTSRRPARTTIITSTLVAAALCLAPVTPALAAGAADTPAAAEQAATEYSAALAATPWETTAATDQDGNPVALDDARAANFVGWAYFKQGGTFTMYTLDDKPKMQGDWTVAPDGSSRWIAAKNDAGDVLFERTVPIVTLTADEFTYRVIDQADPTQWVDIVHTPTTHQEPGTIDYSAALAATPWETTAATDQDGNPVALDDARAANFVGWAYFKQGGTFTMYTLDDKPKMQGDWTVAPDGSSRWIAAKNDAGDVLFERTVPIVTLTADEFTYRVIDQADPTQWVDIVHTPTTHQEPTGGGDTGGETNPGGGGGETPGGTGGTGDGSTPTPEPGDTGGADGTGGTGTTGGTGATGGTGDAAAAAPGGTAPDGAKGHTADTLAATGGSGLLVSAAASALAILGGAILFVRRALAGARG